MRKLCAFFTHTYLLFILSMLVSCQSTNLKKFNELDKKQDTIIEKTQIIKADVKTLKEKVKDCNIEVVEQVNDIEIKITELEGEEHILKNNINNLKDNYKQEIKELKNKIRVRDVVIGFLVVYLVYRFLILK